MNVLMAKEFEGVMWVTAADCQAEIERLQILLSESNINAGFLAHEIERLQRENEELREKASDEMYANARLEEELAALKRENEELRHRLNRFYTNTDHGITMQDRHFTSERDVVYDENFDHDAHLTVYGDFESAEQRWDYAKMICGALNELASLKKQLAEAKKDAERLDFITTFGKPWSVQWMKKGSGPIRFRMIDDGEPYGPWFPTAREAIDQAMREGE